MRHPVYNVRYVLTVNHNIILPGYTDTQFLGKAAPFCYNIINEVIIESNATLLNCQFK